MLQNLFITFSQQNAISLIKCQKLFFIISSQNFNIFLQTGCKKMKLFLTIVLYNLPCFYFILKVYCGVVICIFNLFFYRHLTITFPIENLESTLCQKLIKPGYFKINFEIKQFFLSYCWIITSFEIVMWIIFINNYVNQYLIKGIFIFFIKLHHPIIMEKYIITLRTVCIKNLFVFIYICFCI